MLNESARFERFTVFKPPALPEVFDSTVTGTGATVITDTLSGLSGGSSWDRGDYTITTTNGNYARISSPATDNSTGQMIGISPRNPAPLSGITFDSPINALGFEVGDWATAENQGNGAQRSDDF